MSTKSFFAAAMLAIPMAATAQMESNPLLGTWLCDSTIRLSPGATMTYPQPFIKTYTPGGIAMIGGTLGKHNKAFDYSYVSPTCVKEHNVAGNDELPLTLVGDSVMVIEWKDTDGTVWREWAHRVATQQPLYETDDLTVMAVTPVGYSKVKCDYDFSQLAKMLVDYTGAPTEWRQWQGDEKELCFMLTPDGQVAEAYMRDPNSFAFNTMARIYAETYGNPFSDRDGVLAAALELMPSVKHGCKCPLYVTARMRIQETDDKACVVSLGNYSKTINLKASDLHGVWKLDKATTGGRELDWGNYWKAYRENGRAYMMTGRNFPYFVVDDHHTSDGEKMFPITFDGDKMTLRWQHNMGHYIDETWHRVKGVVNKKDTIFDHSSDIHYGLIPSLRGASYQIIADNKLKERQTAHVYYTCVLEADGSLSNIKILRSSNKKFNKRIIELIKTFRFEPAVKDGRPVRYFLCDELTVVFRPQSLESTTPPPVAPAIEEVIEIADDEIIKI